MSALKRRKLTESMPSSCTVTTRSRFLQKVTSGLPDEIWLRILGHLSTVDISVAGATCTRLYNLTKDLSLWEKLEFDIANVNAHLGAVQGVMIRATNVKEIKFTNIRSEGFDSMTVASLIVRASKTLKVLTLSHDIELENEAVSRFGCLVNLEVLDIPFEQIGTRWLGPLAINNLLVNRIAPRGLQAISMLKSLRELRIPFTIIPFTLGDMDLQFLFEELNNLVTIDLICFTITRNTFKTLAENNPNLETVILRFCLNYLQPPSLSDLVSKCPNLKHLNLRGWSGMSSDNLKALANAKNLVHLDLGKCHHLTDDILANISKNSSKLKYLDLTNCRDIKNSGIRALIQNCPNLEQLNIRGCNSVTMEVIEEIVMVCRKLDILVTPRLHDVTPKAKKKLRKSHPNLAVM